MGHEWLGEILVRTKTTFIVFQGYSEIRVGVGIAEVR
jgi:hypothetical protein